MDRLLCWSGRPGPVPGRGCPWSLHLRQESGDQGRVRSTAGWPGRRTPITKIRLRDCFGAIAHGLLPHAVALLVDPLAIFLEEDRELLAHVVVAVGCRAIDHGTHSGRR